MAILEIKIFELDQKKLRLPAGITITHPATRYFLHLDEYLPGVYAVITRGDLIDEKQHFTSHDKTKAKQAFNAVSADIERGSYQVLFEPRIFNIKPNCSIDLLCLGLG